MTQQKHCAMNICKGLWVNLQSDKVTCMLTVESYSTPKLWLSWNNPIHLWTILIPLSRFLSVVIPAASALPLSTHVKSNVIRFKPTFALRTRMHMVHAPPGYAFSPQLIPNHSDNISGKHNFISINNEIITVRSKPWQTVLVDQKRSIFSTPPWYRPNSVQVANKNACGNLIVPRSIWNSAQSGCM